MLERWKAMPMKPLNPCRHPGCPNITEERYCTVHAPDHKRATAHERGYTSKWQRLSKLYLKTNPLCVECKRRGRLTPATVVDHIVPHRGNEQLMWSESNWQALCKPCHDKKTGTQDKLPTYKYNFWPTLGGQNLKNRAVKRPPPPFLRIFAKITKGGPLRIYGNLAG